MFHEILALEYTDLAYGAAISEEHVRCVYRWARQGQWEIYLTPTKPAPRTCHRDGTVDLQHQAFQTKCVASQYFDPDHFFT